eukprot:scaffold10540_cov116-Isochrysis_galbana.AAC.8
MHHGRAPLTQLLPHNIHVVDRRCHQTAPDVVEVKRGEQMVLRALAPSRGTRPDEPAKPPAARPCRLRHGPTAAPAPDRSATTSHPPHTLHRACMPPRLRLGEALACPSRLALSPPLLRPP